MNNCIYLQLTCLLLVAYLFLECSFGRSWFCYDKTKRALLNPVVNHKTTRVKGEKVKGKRFKRL